MRERVARGVALVRPGRVLEGAGLGIAAWLVAGLLGVPRIGGISDATGVAYGAAAGALAGRWRPGVVRAGAAAAGLAYALVGWTPLAPALLAHVVRRDPIAARPAVDAVAVLSADVRTDGLVYGTGLSRLLAGAAWARALDRPLVISVVRHRGVRGAPSSEADQRALTALAGVTRLHVVDSVFVTRDEAVREAALARRMGWHRLLVVTSPSHSRRACGAYERAGVTVVCAPAPAREYALGGPAPLATAPERAAAFRDWLYEAVGWAVYRARGWV